MVLVALVGTLYSQYQVDSCRETQLPGLGCPCRESAEAKTTTSTCKCLIYGKMSKKTWLNESENLSNMGSGALFGTFLQPVPDHTK